MGTNGRKWGLKTVTDGNFSKKAGNGHENRKGNGLHPVFLLGF
jgi:hypothetical protein